jgi:multiple sugar transport system permease protein
MRRPAWLSVLVNVLAWGFVFVVVFPLIWVLLTSIKPQPELLRVPPSILPREPTLEYYWDLLTDSPFLLYFRNSVLISVATTVLVIIIGTLGAFGLVRFAFPGRDKLALLILFTYLLPSVVIILPLYLLVVRMGLANSLFSLMIAYTTLALPYAVWLLRSFMRGIPQDCESAALIDGASRLGAFVDVILPQAVPGIISTALFTFILAWNEYLYPLVLINIDAAQPLTTGVSNMLINSFSINWPQLMAASAMMSLPLVIIFAVLQSYLTRGFGAGSIKG